MKIAVLLCALCLLGGAAAWPKVNCASWTCSAGWRVRTDGTPLENIACLNETCNDRTCCWAPTCLSTASLWGGCDSLKANAAAIQCPSSDPAKCSSALCCAGPCAERHFYYTDFLGSPRVNKMRVIVNASGIFGVQGSQTLVATPPADGIMFHPTNPKVLIVGGQTTKKVMVIDLTNPDPAHNWHSVKSGDVRSFHVSKYSNSIVLGTDIDNGVAIARHEIAADGTVQVATPIAVVGDDSVVSSVIVGSNGKYWYTTGNEEGPGNFGELTFDAAMATANTRRIDTSENAHAGRYDAYSNTLLVWGKRAISQRDPATGAVIRTRDLTTLIGGTGGLNHVDQGALDGSGRVMMAANNGRVVWLDFKASKNINDATTLSGWFPATSGAGLDALTEIVCVPVSGAKAEGEDAGASGSAGSAATVAVAAVVGAVVALVAAAAVVAAVVVLKRRRAFSAAAAAAVSPVAVGEMASPAMV